MKSIESAQKPKDNEQKIPVSFLSRAAKVGVVVVAATTPGVASAEAATNRHHNDLPARVLKHRTEKRINTGKRVNVMPGSIAVRSPELEPVPADGFGSVSFQYKWKKYGNPIAIPLDGSTKIPKDANIAKGNYAFAVFETDQESARAHLKVFVSSKDQPIVVNQDKRCPWATLPTNWDVFAGMIQPTEPNLADGNQAVYDYLRMVKSFKVGGLK